jgi:hypothetical protein
MIHAYWFGVTMTFPCNSCRMTSVEKIALNSPTNDPAKLNEKINRESLVCSHCKHPLAQGVLVHVQVEPGTRQSLRSAGFPIPLDN